MSKAPRRLYFTSHYPFKGNFSEWACIFTPWNFLWVIKFHSIVPIPVGPEKMCDFSLMIPMPLPITIALSTTLSDHMPFSAKMQSFLVAFFSALFGLCSLDINLVKHNLQQPCHSLTTMLSWNFFHQKIIGALILNWVSFEISGQNQNSAKSFGRMQCEWPLSYLPTESLFLSETPLARLSLVSCFYSILVFHIPRIAHKALIPASLAHWFNTASN